MKHSVRPVSAFTSAGLAAVCASLMLGGPGCTCGGDRAGDQTRGARARPRALAALPYLATTPVAKQHRGKAGVTRWDRARAQPGLTAFILREGPRGFHVMDLKGRILKSWTGPRVKTWHHAIPTPDGGLLAIAEEWALLRLDAQSRVLWTARGRYHHDVTVGPDGRIYTLGRNNALLRRDGKQFPILDDTVAVLSPRGELLASYPVSPLFGRLVSQKTLGRIASHVQRLDRQRAPGSGSALPPVLDQGFPWDVFHTNTVEVLDREIPGVCRRGDLLISIRMLDTIAIVDPRLTTVRWSWGPGELVRQHQPTLLPRGTILLFDNGSDERPHSRVLEVDPRTRKIVWSYQAQPPTAFYSEHMSGAQLLANDNVLITEGATGRIFEITRAGEVVWEWFSPLLPAAEADPTGHVVSVGGKRTAGAGKRTPAARWYRPTVYRATRYPRAHLGDLTPRRLPARLDLEIGSGSASQALYHGFHAEEFDGDQAWVWSSGPRSLLQFALRPAPGPYLLVVQAQAFEPVAPVQVTVEVNGNPAGTLTVLAHKKTHSLTLPRGRLTGGTNRIALRYSRTGRPARLVRGSSDTRELAVRFYRILLYPAGS
jgi:hypothetical protein